MSQDRDRKPIKSLTGVQLLIGLVMLGVGSVIGLLGVAYGIVLFSYPFLHPNSPPQPGSDFISAGILAGFFGGVPSIIGAGMAWTGLRLLRLLPDGTGSRE